MATATIEKKKCRDIKACKGSPAFKGCGKNFVITKKNFEVNKNSKDGFNHTCLKCKAKFETFKKELQAETTLKEEAKAKAGEEKKLLKRRAKEAAERVMKKKADEEKASLKAKEDSDRIAREAEEAKAKEEKEAKAEKAIEDARIAQEKEDEEREVEEVEEVRIAKEAEDAKALEEEEEQRKALDEALKRPEVTFDQVKQARLFGKKSEDTIEKLTGLAKLEENVIIFLHSIMLFADPDDELYATKEDVQKDMCERFRVDGLATLKPFTWKAAREDWIVCRKERVGFDAVKNTPIEVTTHYNITAAGIEWYNLWIGVQGLPKPIVPKKLRIPKAKEVQTIDGHSGSSSPGQVNTAFELALNEGQNSANAKDMYINFLIDYKKEHKCTYDSLGKKIGISGPLVSLACGKQRCLSPAHYPAIAVLMNINKTKPVEFGKSSEDVDRSAGATQTEMPKQTALPSRYTSTNKNLERQPNILVNAIAQATKEHSEALMDVKEAELKVRIYANKIQFLESEFHQIV